MKAQRYVIGLTGGIASGKSTALEIFRKKGIPTISSDELSHACMEPGTSVYKNILRQFGTDLKRADGKIDRKKLGQLVFRNPSDRKKLEKLVHPCVLKGLKAFIQKHTGMVVLDIPLLFEAHLEKWVDVIVVVYATPSQQIARLMARNKFTRTEALQRINAQWSLKRKVSGADHVIKNTKTFLDLKQGINKFIEKKLDSVHG